MNTKKLVLSALLICLFYVSFGQKTSDLFYSNSKVSWLGIDFSHVKLIGVFSEISETGVKNSTNIKNKYFPSWNNLFLTESDKYDIKGMLQLNEITNDIDMIMAKNAQTPDDGLEAYKAVNFTSDDLKNFVNEYSLDGKTGLGVVFIVESLNKTSLEASLYCVILNMATKEILISQHFVKSPSGFGLRNYWAGAFYKTIREIKSDVYSQWKRQYGRK